MCVCGENSWFFGFKLLSFSIFRNEFPWNCPNDKPDLRIDSLSGSSDKLMISGWVRRYRANPQVHDQQASEQEADGGGRPPPGQGLHPQDRDQGQPGQDVQDNFRYVPRTLLKVCSFVISFWKAKVAPSMTSTSRIARIPFHVPRRKPKWLLTQIKSIFEDNLVT